MSFLKILVKLLIALLITCLIAIISYVGLTWYSYHKFDNNYLISKENKNGRILIVWYRGLGEQEFIERIKIAANKLNWDVMVATTKPRFYFRWFIKDPLTRAIQLAKPDFILTIQDSIDSRSEYPNYLTLTHGTSKYIAFDQQGSYLIDSRNANFDSILPTFMHIDKLKAALKRAGRNDDQAIGIAWYPTSNANDFSPSEKFPKLFYSGGFLWDTTRASDKYMEFFTLLDKKGYLQVCGPKHKWRHTPNSLVGFIPTDGISLIKAQHQAGVSLLLHTDVHIAGGAPTGRIFEAASANTVIISDRHPFVEQHFGDNVFYIDINLSAKEIFQQIDQHMTWIKNHPKEARQMAQKCHDIFMQKFTLESQLKNLIEFHFKLNR